MPVDVIGSASARVWLPARTLLFAAWQALFALGFLLAYALGFFVLAVWRFKAGSGS